ncbi:S8 family serine peptidase [Halorarius halobius]|uniref:S8 family serine peptidase n=1 Tax=Halorarius halobius TaxID=2962671 RepID=UPI0020CE8894|nr:S8 family serine peptidase [Halorarius halobius]
MQFDRRTLLQSTAAVGGAALFPMAGGARTPEQTLDDRLDTGGGPQEVVVVFTSNEAVEALDRFTLPEGYYRFETLPMGYAVATGEQIERISRLQSVVRVVPNYELEWFNDDAREVTNAESVAAELGYDGTHGHVAVIDTGLDGPHPDHQINVAHNYKYTNPLDRGTMWVDMGKADTDGNGHGTHVSGSVAGDGSVERANRGMAPKATLTMYSTGAGLLIVNALGAFDHLIARKEAGRTNVQAVNNSFGAISGNGQNMDPANPDIVASYHAYQAGILPVIAAGNCGPDGGATCTRTGDNTLGNTAQAPWVLGIAATRDDGNVTGFSSRGRPPSSDSIHNYDRDVALANYEEFLDSLEPPTAADTETVYEVAGSGVIANFLVQTADTFALSASPDTALSEVNGFYVDTTLTWSPSSGAGAPEPSEFEYRLIGPEDDTVATAGSTFVDGTRNEAALTIGTYLPLPDDSAQYELEVTSSRGGGQYQVDGTVVAVDAEDGIPDPERPFGIERPSVGAPGNSIVSTMMIGDQLADQSNGIYYQAISGTSMATPVTAGVVALVNDAYYSEFGAYPDVLEVIDVIEETARFLEEKNHTVHNIGKGLVDAEAAVEEMLARGRAERDDGATAPPPTVDSYEVTEAGGESAHAEITANWAVSDGDENLDAVVVEVIDESGAVVRERTTAVDGATASGTDEFEIRGANDEEFEVVLTVTDAQGNRATASATVGE